MRSVLFVIPRLSNGGAERVTVNVTNGLAQRGYRVGIVSFKPGGDYLKDLHPDIAVHCIHRRLPRFIHHYQAIAGLAKLSEHYDVIVSGLVMATDAIVHGCKLLNEKRHLPRRYLARIDTTLSQAPYFQKKSPKRRAKLLEMLSQFDQLITVSDGVRDDLRQLAGRPLDITTIYNPLAIESIVRLSLDPVDDLPETPFFINVGRFVYQKDHATLLEAFHLFLRQSPTPYRLLLFGRGPLLREVTVLCRQLQLEEFVEFRGFSGNVWKYMRHARALVLSSVVEGLPCTLMEAMAVRTPIISTDCPSGPAEILQHGRYGQLVEMRSPAALAAAMLEVVAHPEETQRRVDAAAEFAQRTFALPVIIQAYADAIERC